MYEEEEEAAGDLAESGGTRRHSSRQGNASSLREIKGEHEKYVLLQRWKQQNTGKQKAAALSGLQRTHP